ncbi:hypothetical protein [Porphyrobacter sp. HT-58-2]|uniref:hypothetical protein n=1 Tax=Porphyrobacter sp. HT-58-2 TaxID=2023229 RepID=UPI001F40E7B5|nr:hypothetical protein [Porphyrobacter sp. HT-58-2]
MASLSSSRPARTARTQSFLTLGLAIAAGLGQGTLALSASPLAAQAQAGDADAPEPKDEATSEGFDEAFGSPPGAEPEAEADLAPVPAPVPRSLDELIPADAVTNPEAWAAAGVSDRSPALPTSDLLPDAALTGLEPFADGQPFALSLDATFADFALDLPEPLPADPEVEALVSITAPLGGELPELAETRISSALVLALPAARESFPEQREFIARFRDLSTLQELDDGEESAPQVTARARADAELLGDMLRTYGYYDGEVVRQLSGGRRASSNGASESASGGAGNGADAADAEAAAVEPRVRFDILPGKRYAFGRIDLGDLPTLAEPDASRLVAAFDIKPGDPLYADRIIEREIELRVALGETGYPFAKVAEPELLIDHDRQEGDLSLNVQPGGKYVFGDVVSSDPRFLSGRHLSRIARFDQGDVFQQSLETDLRRAVIATGLVSSVTVTPA